MKTVIVVACLASLASGATLLPSLFGSDKLDESKATFFPTEKIDSADPRTTYTNLPLKPPAASATVKEGEKPKKDKPDDTAASMCCQICPNQFYQELSFLQLPHHVEAEAVARFKTWHAALNARREGARQAPTGRRILGTRRRRALHHAARNPDPPATGLMPSVGPPKCDFQGEPKFVEGTACCNICDSDHYKSEDFSNIRYPPPAVMTASGLAKYLRSKPAHEAFPCPPKYNPMPSTQKTMPCCGLCPKEFVPNVIARPDQYGPPEADPDGYTTEPATTQSPALLELEAELGRTLDAEVSVRHAGKTEWHKHDAAVFIELAGSTAALADAASGAPQPPGPGSCCIMCPANTYFNGPFDTPFGEPLSEGKRAAFRNFAHRKPIRDAKNKRIDYVKTGII